jgi:orotidine-5'-phosphate decarboxylase
MRINKRYKLKMKKIYNCCINVELGKLRYMKSFNSRLSETVKNKKSCLCVGLDMNPDAFGSNSLKNLKEHTFKVIDATREFAVAYKPNFAFFERWGAAGFAWLEETVLYIGDDHIKIADAKRGDIGNTAEQYAESVFKHFGFDSVTINPYLGEDSIRPFINDTKKGVFILCRTSNPSAKDLQNKLIEGKPLYYEVAMLAKNLNKFDNIGLVVGATASEELSQIRSIVPDLPLLIPGIGAQGGDLEHSVQVSNNTGVGLINVSRAISFAEKMTYSDIHNAAKKYHQKIKMVLEK